MTRSIDRLTACQDQITREINKLQAIGQQILRKNSEPPPRPVPASVRKPVPRSAQAATTRESGPEDTDPISAMQLAGEQRPNLGRLL